MLNQIDLFSPDRSRYHVLHYFTKKFHEAIVRSGVQSRLFPPPTNANLPNIVSSLIKNPPDCTLAFNGLLPDSKGQFLADTLQIPHVACLVDAPNHFLNLIKSAYTMIGCIDLSFCDFFQELSFPQTFFFPHAVAAEDASLIEKKREYDVVMLASNMDFERIRKNWKKRYPHPLCQVLDDAADQVLSDTTTTHLQAFFHLINTPYAQKNIDLKRFNSIAILSELEDYIRSKDRVELLRAVEGIPVHLFGQKQGWKPYLRKNSTILLEGQVSFTQVQDILQRSKILLNSMPNYKHGAHERIFSGLIQGALPVTNKNVFMERHFQDKQNIAFYRSKHWHEVPSILHAYLSNENLRSKVALEGKLKVMKEHTWDQRVQSLKESLPPLLEKIRGY